MSIIKHTFTFSHNSERGYKLYRAKAQAVSRRLPTAAARFRFHVRSCGICSAQSDTRTCFPRVLQLPLPILTPPTAPQSLIIQRYIASRLEASLNNQLKKGYTVTTNRHEMTYKVQRLFKVV
jgi:hypothetical protein